MRILVISHNPFGNENNMGRTLKSYFDGFEKHELAQLYVRSDKPDMTVCDNYYRITDADMLKSVLTRKSGRVVSREAVDPPTVTTESAPQKKPSGKRKLLSALYKKGKSRSPEILFARDMLWKVGAWKTPALCKWVDDFDPEVVFLASGDYAFIYDVAHTLARERRIPLFVCCVDDFYFFNKNGDRALGRSIHSSFMKRVGRCMEYARGVFTICDKMSEDYGSLFNKPCYTVYTPYSVGDGRKAGGGEGICYLGNISCGRAESLAKIGRALKSIDEGMRLTVYSPETREEFLSYMTEENGIDFRGRIPTEEVRGVMDSSMAVIHTESFAEIDMGRVKYSVSTKIADSLAYGCCIFAFGPMDVESVRYLYDSGTAICATSEDELKSSLNTLLYNSEERERCREAAYLLGRKNHDPKKNQDTIRKALSEAVASFGAVETDK